MFDFLRRRSQRVTDAAIYDRLRQPTGQQSVNESDHISPSGKNYAHVRTQSWTSAPAPEEVDVYIAKARKAAADLGIADFEVWSQNTPQGAMVRFGTTNSRNHGRMMVRMHGDERGRHARSQTFENMSSAEIGNWITSARKMLDKNGISYKVDRTDDNQVEFVFDSSANSFAFNAAVDRGLVDQMAQGNDTTKQFAGFRNSILGKANRSPMTFLQPFLDM